MAIIKNHGSIASTHPTREYSRPRPTETDLQKQIIAYIRVAYPAWIVHHSPNEGSLSYGSRSWNAQLAKGTKAGWPDLDILAPGGRTLRMEVKRDPTCKPSAKQVEMMNKLSAIGHPNVCVDNFEVARYCIDTFAKGENPKTEFFV